MGKSEQFIKDLKKRTKDLNPVLQENQEKDVVYKMLADLLQRVSDLENKIK